MSCPWLGAWPWGSWARLVVHDGGLSPSRWQRGGGRVLSWGYIVGARLGLHGVCRPISYVVNGGEKFLYRQLSREDLILGDIVSLK